MGNAQRVHRTELRARFARRLSALYGTEVPAYTTLVQVAAAVNADVLAADPEHAQRLGSIERVTAERHGAIRLGTPAEMAQVAQVFAGFGMFPVGFYDLRDASSSSVPVTSTAFRPTDRAELAQNPFRVFTSMLMTEDRRFFSPEVRRQLAERFAARHLFTDELLALARRAEAEDGLPAELAEEFVVSATAVFALSTDPVDRDWYATLEAISAVAADIGGVGSTHINHLTPRVLDIDDLYARMTARGITMIDQVQGPPRWAGPDVLLRQTSFRALAEPRRFRASDGTVTEGELRVRFGEVEQRGVALTPAGRAAYDAALVEVERRVGADPAGSASSAGHLAQVWIETFPDHEAGLDETGLAFFGYHRVGPTPDRPTDLATLVDRGIVARQPIVYEDFLPKSAAGIFQSNLSDAGTRDDTEVGAQANLATMSEVLGRPVADPMDLYAAERDASLRQLERDLGWPDGTLTPLTPTSNTATSNTATSNPAKKGPR